MREWFIKSHSFAAPFVSDEDFHHVEAETAAEALTLLACRYKHPAGLYAANAYESADAFHKGQRAVAAWRSNQAEAVKGASTTYTDRPGRVEIDGKWTDIRHPKAGRVTAP